MVDDIDFERVSMFKWQLSSSGYARRGISVNKRTMKCEYMHRFIIDDIPKGMEIDHIDRNKLNNTRQNLRIVDRGLNNQNRKASGECEYFGVYIKKNRTKKYVAQIRANGKRETLGHYLTAEEAAFAYNKAAIRLLGEDARLNIIKPVELPLFIF